MAGPRRIRLCVDDDLAAGRRLALAPGQAHYARNVMRLAVGGEVLLFNGRDGEWRGRIEGMGRGRCAVRVTAPTRPQEDEADLWLVFAPVKRGRTALVVEKATEMGVSAIVPVRTRRSDVARVNAARLALAAREAAEQSGRLTVPEVREACPLEALIARWPRQRRLLLCDASAAAPPIAEALPPRRPGGPAEPWAVLAGPEGGFAPVELDALRKLPFVIAAGLGPRTLRAETAAIAALACVQALVGTWRRRA